MCTKAKHRVLVITLHSNTATLYVKRMFSSHLWHCFFIQALFSEIDKPFPNIPLKLLCSTNQLQGLYTICTVHLHDKYLIPLSYNSVIEVCIAAPLLGVHKMHDRVAYPTHYPTPLTPPPFLCQIFADQNCGC